MVTQKTVQSDIAGGNSKQYNQTLLVVTQKMVQSDIAGGNSKWYTHFGKQSDILS